MLPTSQSGQFFPTNVSFFYASQLGGQHAFHPSAIVTSASAFICTLPLMPCGVWCMAFRRL
jgi:hypothetical protein